MRNGVCLIRYAHSIAVDIPVCDDNSAIMLQLKCLLYVTSHCESYFRSKQLLCLSVFDCLFCF